MKTINYICLAMLLSLSSCGSDSEKRYPSYEAFAERWARFAQFLPESSTEIRHYKVLDFDTNYHYIEASVKIEDFKQFAERDTDFGDSTIFFDVLYSDERFDQRFYKRPRWWNQDTMLSYSENFMHLFADKNNYGTGCWLFYNSTDHKIRVFVWNQQWLSQDEVKTIFGL